MLINFLLMNITFPYINPFSFWLGFAVATVIWLLVGALRPLFSQTKEVLRSKREDRRVITTNLNTVQEHYLKLALQYAQGYHLVASLFSLDEIIMPPLLLAPPPRVEPGGIIHLNDAVSLSVPYLPAWPELNCFYDAPTLTLAQALSGNSDIVLVGQPGSGKSVALAYLTSRLAMEDENIGLPPGTIPFLFHVADLDLPLKKDDPLIPIADAISDRVSVFDAGRIPDFVYNIFAGGRALLLLDGTDELTSENLPNVVNFIKAVKRTFPKTRIVTTASPDYLDGLVTLNFLPFIMAPWNQRTRNAFFEKWGECWTKFVALEDWAKNVEQIDPILLNTWLTSENTILTPLEYTLKAWAAYSGDGCGAHSQEALETHLRRITPDSAPRSALEMLAMQIQLAGEPIFDPHKAREWVKSFEPAEVDNTEGTTSETQPGKKSLKPEKNIPPSLGLISKLADTGLLTSHRGNKMRFSHQVFFGMLAGAGFKSYKSEALIEQRPWSGKTLALNYFAASGDASALVDRLLATPDRPFERNLLIPARWLRDAPKNSPWRNQVLKRLSQMLSHEGQPLGIRGQALIALILSEDPAVPYLFQKLSNESSAELLQLVALGMGALRDTKSVDQLTSMLNNPNQNVGRAACLALVRIGTPGAIDGVAYALLHGTEQIRRAAAEALSTNRDEGFAILKEGAEMDDFQVRRAVSYGLGRIDEGWAKDLLVKLQLNDKEWLVRSSATELLEAHNQPNPYIPHRLPPPSESPWLLEFAGKHGLGVAPDKPPIDILLTALKTGTEEERLAAIAYLRLYPNEGVFGALFKAMYGGDPALREAIFLILWEMSARGVDVPDPVQYGVG